MENINLNIPIFRAEEINSDGQVIGYLKDKDTIMEIIGICIRPVSIKSTTLAIHFPDMLANDSDRLLPNGKKDLRIFASLSKNGKGGDISNEKFSFIFNNGLRKKYKKWDKEYKLPKVEIDELKQFKVIGIQK